jgi:hypothetical protein
MTTFLIFYFFLENFGTFGRPWFTLGSSVPWSSDWQFRLHSAARSLENRFVFSRIGLGLGLDLDLDED